jgi:anti-anti-sigma factor
VNSRGAFRNPGAASELRRHLSLDLHGRAGYLLQIVAVTAAYTISGKLGLKLAFESKSVTAIWPPTGIALAALVIGGVRLWPGVALGALLTNLGTGVSALTLTGIVSGNTLEALVGAFLLVRVVRFRPSLQGVRDVLALVLFGAFISTAVSASIGVSSLLIGGAISSAHLASVWRTWWLGDMGGDLIVAPPILIAASRRSFSGLPGRAIEAVALALLLLGVSVLVFSQSTSVVYAVFPLLIWAALRFWQPGAAFGSLLVAAVAVTFTANGEGPFAMSNPDERLLLAQTFTAVAGIGALVLAAVTRERRRAEDAERKIAETLQQSLLPEAAPSIAGWEIATLYRAAGAAEVQVGGDFYDFFPTDAGWTLILGDVAGKGVEAAAMAALVRSGARFVGQAEQGPSAILARLDEALRQRATLSLCSALCVRLNGGSLLLSSAGHPGPLIVRGDGRIREIAGGGPMLGVSPNATWPERSVEVEPGETVLLYTDGVTETRGATQRFGLGRLGDVLVDHAECSPTELLAQLELALGHFQLGPQSDDTAALALRFQPVSEATERISERPARPRAAGSANGSQASLDGALVVSASTHSIEVAGEIDHANAAQLLEAFERVNGNSGSEFVLDLARVMFVDSVGLRTVIDIQRRAYERGMGLQVISPPEHVRTVFRLSGADRQLHFKGQPVQPAAGLEYPERVELELAAGDRAPQLARVEVREAVAGKLQTPESELAVLLTSELVTNAVVHPGDRDGDSIGLRISTDRGRARVEVADSGGGFDPGTLQRDETAAGGRGLLLVDRGAVRWGTRRDDRFRIWFEL